MAAFVQRGRKEKEGKKKPYNDNSSLKGSKIPSAEFNNLKQVESGLKTLTISICDIHVQHLPLQREQNDFSLGRRLQEHWVKSCESPHLGQLA